MIEDIAKETLIKSNSPRSNEHTHAAEFDTLRFNQRVPKYIIETGINNTESGNWHIAFDEINSLFGTNLPTDADTLQTIQDHISENYSEEVADMDCSEDFDMLFYTDCCPNFIEEHEP